MRIGILCVGEVRGPLASGVAEFEDRARRYWRLEVSEVASGLGKGRKPRETAIREAEDERLLSRLPASGETVALTREGTFLTSRQLAGQLEEWALRSVQDVTFVIGGAFGLGPGVLRRASLKLALSSMTLPHELARLVLAEQLYRAGTILRHEPYHKGP